MTFQQAHVAHKFTTAEGERWVVIHKPEPTEVSVWERFVEGNRDAALRATTDEKRQQAIRGAAKGFLNATELYNPRAPDTEHYLLFAFVTQYDPWTRPLALVLPHVEMYMTVTGAITCPVITHMGITRVFNCRNPSSRLAVRFHGLTAWLLTRGELKRGAVRPKYMVTAPLQFMGDELAKVGGAELKVQKIGTGWAQATAVKLPDEQVLKCSPLELSWLAKLAFTHDKPMIIAYDTLIGLANPHT